VRRAEPTGVTTYLQLVQQVRDALRLGLLEPGDRLPTVTPRDPVVPACAAAISEGSGAAAPW
jgi:hypothetical protein